MTDLPEVKLKALVNFPVTAVGRTGIDTTRDGGRIYLDLNYSDFQITPTVSAEDMPNSYNLIWNEETQLFAKVPFSLQATSGVSSIDGQTGAIDIGATLQMTGSTLEVAPFDYVSGIDGKDGAITLDGSLQTTLNVLSVDTVDLSGGVSTVVYEQAGASVSAPLIRRLNNTVFASEFGAVGDDSTNDYGALQEFLDEIQSTGKEGRLDPGKKYYVSGADLTLAAASGLKNVSLYGNGSQIRTNAAEARTALVVQHIPAVTREDESRRVLVSGLTINHIDNANATFGINVIGSPHVTIEGCSFLAGSDTAIANQASYSSLRFGQSNVLDPNYGSFWCRVLNNTFKGASTVVPSFITLQGSMNAMVIEGNDLASGTRGVFFVNPSAGLNSNEAYIANGVRILNNDFEGITHGVIIVGTAGYSAIHGLMVAYNRIESVGTVFFNYQLDTASNAAPILGPNYIDSGSWGKYLASASALAIDVRDEYVGHTTINPASLAANATTTIGTVTVSPSAAGDQVKIETSGDLQGVQATGYVSSANTVTIRLSNPTSGAVDLGSLKWIARVRPQY